MLFFNCDGGGKGWTRAEKWREDALAYLKRLFENKAGFACIARDENKSSVLLRGYVNLKSPCRQPHLLKGNAWEVQRLQAILFRGDGEPLPVCPH